MKLDNWTRKHALLLIFAVMLPIAAYMVFDTYVLDDMYVDVESNKEHIDNLRIVTDTGDIDNLAEEDIEALRVVSHRIPPTPEPDNVLSSFHLMAGDAGVDIKSIRATGSKSDDDTHSSDLREASYDLQVSANTRSQVDLFLDYVVNSERYVRIDSMQVVQQRDSVELKLNFTTFYSGF